MRVRWPNRLDGFEIACYSVACGLMYHYNVPTLAGAAIMIIIVFGAVIGSRNIAP